MPAGDAERDEIELSSPACAIREADAAYMGYAGAAELAALVAALLPILPPLQAETLRRHLAVLGEAAPAEGDREGLRCRLQAILPRVREDALYRDLRAALPHLGGAP